VRGQPQSLALEKPEHPTEVVYPAKSGKAVFNFKFSEDTELSGYMKLRLWVEARPGNTGDISPDDMAMFIAVNKLDKDGKTVYFYGSAGNMKDMVTRGYCKVSRRELDPNESTEWHPVQKGTSEHKLKEGEIVLVDIEIYPSSTFFSSGETLQLIIASDEIILSPIFKKSVDCNHGKNVLHFGGKYDSYLLVPQIRSVEA
jgi:predicted acyl esterase